MFGRLKELIPQSWLSIYHYILARAAAAWYGHPSKRLIVIGVTGTNGKTTTTYYLSKALEASGFQTGCTSTAVLKVGPEEWLNPTKMTMPGRFWLQRMLKKMVEAGCHYAVIETSSQGLVQHRHIGIDYDIGVFTNLTPEHIEAHGGFENYKQAKRVLFEHIARLPRKTIEGRAVPKAAVINADSEHGEYYAAVKGIENIIWYSQVVKRGQVANDVQLNENGATFKVDQIPVCINQPGAFNVMNALAALTVAKVLGVDLVAASAKLGEIRRVPGRVERVNAGQPWTVIVDYAYEPVAFQQLHEGLSAIARNKTIQVIGSCGGGRDVSRRPVLGRLAAERADIVIVTNEDPYNDDPMLIIDQVAAGAEAAGKVLGKDLFKIIDREQAIVKAMQLAQAGDLVVITGKGCEPWICVANGKKLPWDEIQTAKNAIKYVSHN